MRLQALTALASLLLASVAAANSGDGAYRRHSKHLDAKPDHSTPDGAACRADAECGVKSLCHASKCEAKKHAGLECHRNVSLTISILSSG